MKELPILFSTPMVQALLAGRKTMTRRIMGNGIGFSYSFKRFGKNRASCGIMDISKLTQEEINKLADHAKYQVGDLLWVKETSIFCLEDSFLEGMKSRTIYKASIHEDWFKALKEAFPYYKWTPSIFMPKSAARIWLKVTGVKCERLQDITEEDAMKEGVESYFIDNGGEKLQVYKHYELGEFAFKFDAKTSFRTLWVSINGRESYLSNPWVFAYTFEIISTTGKPDESQI